MEEARASWNTIYIDAQGFECQITLRDERESELAERVVSVTERITKSGGTPVTRRQGNYRARNAQQGSQENSGNGNSGSPDERSRNKTYVDAQGVRRCNLKLDNGKRCNEPVTEREGRYGLFWSCPSYQDHAPKSSS